MNENLPLNANKQAGFSLVELVIVIIILALLAVTALPRLLNITDDAEDATVAGVAGGFATGVGLVRAQWELDGRPNQAPVSTVILDTIAVGVDSVSGYPTGAGDDSGSGNSDADSSAQAMTSTDCAQVFIRILQSSPRITTNFTNTDVDQFDYYTSSVNSDSCVYYLVQSVKKLNSAPTGTTVGRGFEYIPSSGQVTTFTN